MVDQPTDIEIEIDGRVLSAKPSQTVIQVADAAGIYIPRFCYHKHLSVAANCRMCLVDVEKAPKPLPACATPVMPGMKVFTKSQKTIEAQRAVMEFLLINHPLDCPVCDQGGECELQDLSMGFGGSKSNFRECKRSVADESLGPLISTEMTRCILCTRCVRFGSEIAGCRELGVTHRGEESAISTYVKHLMESPVSGNIIDLCPVGALTSKPYRFTARAWELQQTPSVSPHDCLGSHLNVHTLSGTVKRVVPREWEAINQTWISDRDRYSYTGLTHPDRLLAPRIKKNGVWQTVSWEQALQATVEAVQRVLNHHGPQQFGALLSPQSTTEEAFLLQKLMRGLGSPHIDHRLREVDVRDQTAMPLYPGLTASLDDIESSDAIFIIGSHLTHELPLLSLRLRKAIQNGATIAVLNAVDYALNFAVTAKTIAAPHRWVRVLGEWVKGQYTDEMLACLSGKEKVSILLGAEVAHHPQAANLRFLAEQFARKWSGKCHLLTDGPNTAGCWIAGALPHRGAGGVATNKIGLDVSRMLAQPRKGYLLHLASLQDINNAAQASAAFSSAECVVALTAYHDEALEAHATILLPVAPFTETSGTYINAFGDWHTFTGMAKPAGEARPAWKVLRVLANFLHVDGFDYQSTEAILDELKSIQALGRVEQELADLSMDMETVTLSRLGDIPLYAGDALTRHAEPLKQAQAYMAGEVGVLRLHPETANALSVKAGQSLKLKQGQGALVLPVTLDERVARETLWIYGGVRETVALGELMGAIEVLGVC